VQTGPGGWLADYLTTLGQNVSNLLATVENLPGLGGKRRGNAIVGNLTPADGRARLSSNTICATRFRLRAMERCRRTRLTVALARKFLFN